MVSTACGGVTKGEEGARGRTARLMEHRERPFPRVPISRGGVTPGEKKKIASFAASREKKKKTARSWL